MIKTEAKCAIHSMEADDIADVANVHAQSFSRQLNSEAWISCNFKAYPRTRIFVACIDEGIVGYIQWVEKSGFRKEVILELEQIAVLPTFRNHGIGSNLIRSSLFLVRKELTKRGADLKYILVTTRSDNAAQKIYRSVLNAAVEVTIPNLFSADEVIMVSRNVSTIL